MGLFNSLKQEAQRNFIARSDEAKDDILYAYPEHNIRMLTQLTVGADEVALFVKDGTVQGKLGPGKHQLDSNNIPFLSRLLEGFTGGNLFVAELYFVSTREFPGVKFGGAIGDVRDPETGLGIGTMVFGDFSVRVTDPEKLVVGLVGLRRTNNEDFLAWFKSQMLKVVRDHVAELLVKKKWALLDVTSGAFTEEIEQDVLAGVKPHVDSYGLTVVRMGNFTIGIKPEDQATLKRLTKDQAYTKMAGGFQQYAAGQAMLGAAEGMAKGGGEGGGVLQGAGLGVGMGMAQMLQQSQAAPRPAATGPVGTPCPKCGTPGSGKFCSSCGAPMAAALACTKCGGQLTAGAKFCGDCGQPTAA
ncbi:MAG: SPFH domain-containing protein [Myxococcaceae bacterium]